MRGIASLIVALAICACTDDEPAAPPGPQGWTPGQLLPGERTQAPRSLLDVRGVIHAHSVYSHDACDGEPRDPDTDAINEPCFEDFRRDLCVVQHDFVMLTDHGESFARTEFPEVLLYREERGDELVERGGAPIASWAACPEQGDPALILAGTETGFMPVGLEGHVAETQADRDAVYGDETAASVMTLQAQGALVLAQHTEDWTPEQLIDLGFDGFEMFNLHANAVQGAPEALGLLLKQSTPEELPHPDLALLAFISEDPRYLERWGTVLARGPRRVTTMGTDCHRNTFPQLLQDGERVDSYRRTMAWMSNHLLLDAEDGAWDDRDLKAALAAGRLYGAFELMGYPAGFDYHAIEGDSTREMGDEVDLATGVELVATVPTVRDLDPAGPQPDLRLRLLVAEEGGWRTITETASDLSHEVTEAGVYRVEVRMRPLHLRAFLSSYADLAEADFPWIYSNAIYVR